MALKKKTSKKVFTRRSASSFEAGPQNSFRHLRDHVRTEVDKKAIVQKIKKYIKENFKGKKRTDLLSAPDWVYVTCMPFASTIYWKEIGKEFPEYWDVEKNINNSLKYILDHKQLSNEHEKVDKIHKSPMEIVKSRTSDFIAEVEEVLDMFNKEVYVDWKNYSVYNELNLINAPYNIAKGVHDYYLPLMEEIQELVKEKPNDLVESYGHWEPEKRQEYLKILQAILDDCERYMMQKKAVRASRKKKVKTVSKQVENVNYQETSEEYKLVSVSPVKIVGARRVYLFNTKDRKIPELVSRLPGGFEVTGTTINGIDHEISRQTRLRKPLEFLSIIQKKTPKQIEKEWNKLKSKSYKPTGRLNKSTIILNVC